MRKTRNATLNLLSLESRITPAVTAKLNGGNLYVTGDNLSNTIYVSTHAGNQVDVYAVAGHIPNAGANLAVYELPSNQVNATYTVPGNIFINAGYKSGAALPTDPDDFVVVTLDDGTTVPGNLSVNTGQGNDDVQIQTRTNGVATIGGNVSLVGDKAGANNFFMFDTEVNGRTQVNGCDSGTRNDGSGNKNGDVFQVSDCTFHGDVSVINCTTLVDDNYGPNTFDKTLRVNSTRAVLLENYTTMNGLVYPAAPGGTYSGLLVIDAGTTVNGDVSFFGSSAADGVYVDGTIVGRLNVTASGGANDFYLGDRVGSGGAAGTVGGDVSFTGTSGVDHVSIADGSSVGGRLTMNTGNGDNTYDLNHTFSVTGGDVRLTAGSGNDSVGKLGGTVSNNVFANLGNGNNQIEFGFVNATAAVSYTGGSGTDAVQLDGSHKSFNGGMGSGNDTFAYAPGASLTNSMVINGGAGTDTFNKNGVAEVWTVFRSNFEIIVP